MSLLDYFAGQALAGLNLGKPAIMTDAAEVEWRSKRAYDYAQAMLKERTKRLTSE